MDFTVRLYQAGDLPEMTAIWNQVVAAGDAFPQEAPLDADAAAFFDGQTACGVAAETDGTIIGLYILHPNNVGRCGHICNASYAVRADQRGRHVGAALVRHCMQTARDAGFRILQFNAVVKTNAGARHLYETLGFTQLGTIPGGFRLPDGRYEDICPYYIEL